MDVIKALSFVYLLLSALDAIVTVALIKLVQQNAHMHEIEGNPIAAWVVSTFGISGMLAFKATLCLFVITTILVIHKFNDKRHSIFQRFVSPHHLMWFAIIVTTIAISCGLIYAFIYLLPAIPLAQN